VLVPWHKVFALACLCPQELKCVKLLRKDIFQVVRIDDPRGGELGFLFIFKTLMQNLNKVNLHNSRSPNSSNAS
jgi:hypothetical protein